jgi:hypothetical protein
LSHLLERQVFPAAHKQRMAGVVDVQPPQPSGKFLDGNRLLIDADGLVAIHRHHDIGERSFRGRTGFRLRNQSVEPVRSGRRDHHEDDDQHQQDVDHRRHVYVGVWAAVPAG